MSRAKKKKASAAELSGAGAVSDLKASGEQAVSRDQERQREHSTSLAPNRTMPSQMEDMKIMTPSYTSSKTGFHVAPSGRDKDSPRPMEAVTNEQFREEDRFTNATNDPRIGTHGKKQQP